MLDLLFAFHLHDLKFSVQIHPDPVFIGRFANTLFK